MFVMETFGERRDGVGVVDGMDACWLDGPCSGGVEPDTVGRPCWKFKLVLKFALQSGVGTEAPPWNGTAAE